MGKYNDVNALVYDSIQECIEMARICIETQKSDGGCYGMPALILLCAAIDAMGSFYPHNIFTKLLKSFKGVSPGNHFEDFYDAFKSIWEKEISKDDFCKGNNAIVNAYRNRSMHNNGLNNNCLITLEGTKLLVKENNSNERILNIVTMLQLVKKCFDKFQKEHPIELESTVGLESCHTVNNNSTPLITGHT